MARFSGNGLQDLQACEIRVFPTWAYRYLAGDSQNGYSETVYQEWATFLSTEKVMLLTEC